MSQSMITGLLGGAVLPARCKAYGRLIRLVSDKVTRNLAIVVCLLLASCSRVVAPPVQDPVEADKDTSWVTMPHKAQYSSWKRKGEHFIQYRRVKQYRILQ